MVNTSGLNTRGRPPGSVNKATADLKSLAQQYTEDVIIKLAQIAKTDNHPGQVAALKELLDRGHGKAPQSVGLTGNIEIVVTRLDALPNYADEDEEDIIELDAEDYKSLE